MASKSIHFSIATAKNIVKQSVIEVSSTSLYKAKQRIPVDNGVLSLRMGSLDRRLRCATCGNDTLQCPGHFGHISFAAPIYHVGYVKQIVKLLRNFCYWCASVLRCSAAIRRTATSALRKRSFSAASVASNETTVVEKTSSRCVHCQGVIPHYKIDGHKVNVSWPENKSFEKKSRTLPATKALALFCRAASLLDKDSVLYGQIKRLKHAILTVLIVPPPCIRPSVVHEFGGKNRGQDDLTRSLNAIVQCNNKLRDHINDLENVFGKPDKALLADLQWTVSSYMNNDVRGERKATTRIGGSSRDLRNRLVGKNGRVRNTLMGKRVNYSARDVITPDVFLKVDQVGVPKCIAEILLKPVLVNSINVKVLTEQLRTGIVRFVTVLEKNEPPRRVLIDLEKPQNFPLPLQIGWTVERTMLDNDYVCMNRHPSLHRVSMMGHRAKILPDGLLTFRMNPAVCPPYNADFDGDEMNLHLPTTLEAEAELQELLAVQKHIISPQNSRLALGAVQDCALGLYLLTEPVEFSREDFFQLLVLADANFDASRIEADFNFSGFDLVSLFLPEHFTINIPDVISIFNGRMLSGRLSRSVIHTTIAAVVLDYGQDVALELLGTWQLLACSFLSWRGFSIGIDDCTLDDDSSEAIASFIDAALAKVSSSNLSGSLKAQTLSSMLGNLTAIAQRNTGETNSIVLMSASGAKGNSVNLTQIRGAVGQQTINGARVAGTLPAFAHDDHCCERYGFIRNSYTTGLNPTEFFHHAMSGREGIVDTAVKTADTGYLGRRLAKGFESVRTHYGDSSVRNAFGEILQFSYGNDGCDTMWLERFSVAPYFKEPETSCLLSKLKSPETELVLYYSAIVRKLIPITNQLVFVPCDINRLLLQAKAKFGDEPPSTTQNEPEYTRGLVLQLLDCLGGIKNTSTVIYQACIVLCLQYSKFFEHCPSIAARKWLLGECLSRYERAKVAPGEMVGIVAAQSIAQPATQLTLNTFHYAGVLAYNVTLGLPRLKELTDASSSPSSPTMIIPLKNEAFRPEIMKPFLFRTIGSFGKMSQVNAVRFLLNFEFCVKERVTPPNLCDTIETHFPKSVVATAMPYDDEWYIDFTVSAPVSVILKFVLSGYPELQGIKSIASHSVGTISRFSPYLLSCSNVLITTGTSLLEFFGHAGVYDSNIDVYSAYSNHVLEVYSVLGIEAAVAILIAELRHVLSFDGTFVHDRHFQMIVDVMTNTGSIIPLSRHGLNKNMNTGILARASFEATVDQLLEGALRNEIDHLRGVSENIFMGLIPPMGTGTFDAISNCPLLLNGVVTVLPPLNQIICKRATGHGPTLSDELSRIFHIANLLVPFNVSSFCYDKSQYLPQSVPQLDGNSIVSPLPMECLEISSRNNSILIRVSDSLPRRSSKPYRPSSPVAYDASSTRTINPMELLRDIYPSPVPINPINPMDLLRDIYNSQPINY